MTKINKYGLKHQLNQLLKTNKKITLDFDCGNDEAYITPFVDGTQMEYSSSVCQDLGALIYFDLKLPSTGEYEVTGSGYLTLEDDNIYLFYDLEGFTYICDEDEEVCNAEDYEPKKNVTEKMKEKYLLLSSEYDDPEQVKNYLDALASKTIKKTKPWWKFW